jgi:spore germination cell wall hydrolase CwlJ-like protein
VLVCLLLFSLKASKNEVLASTFEQLQEAQEELNSSKEELEEVEEDLSGLTATQKTLKSTLNKLQEDLQEVVDQLTVLEEELQIKEEEIKVTLINLEAAEADEREQYEAMKSRIKFIYERGDVAYIDLVLSARTFSDFLNKADYVELLSEYDREMFLSYQEVVDEITETKILLEKEENELQTLHSEVESKQEEVAKLVDEASSNVSSQQNEIDAVALEKAAKESEVEAQEQTVSELRKQYEAELALSQIAQNSYKRDISEVTFVDGDLKILASIIYCEAGGEPYAGQLAVGAVVINRVLSSRYPDTVVGVVYQPYQFSPVLSGRMEIALTQNKATQSCYDAATEAMSGVTNVDGCLYFRTPIDGVTPQYVIGGHIFY